MTESPPTLTQYVIYERPTDFPEWFVVREWAINADGITPAAAWVCDTLDDARAIVASQSPDAYCIPRQDGDDPKIVEVWT